MKSKGGFQRVSDEDERQPTLPNVEILSFIVGPK